MMRGGWRRAVVATVLPRRDPVPPEFWALLIILFSFAFMASEAVAYFERKVAFYASSR